MTDDGVAPEALGSQDGSTGESPWRTLVQRLDLGSLELCPRERELIVAVFEGLTDAAIAQRLTISTHTVHDYFKRLYRKLDVHDRAALLSRVFSAHLKSLEKAHQLQPGRTLAHAKPSRPFVLCLPPQEGIAMPRNPRSV
jgi:DNA-binding CsgD family transcriptional regulator